MDAIEIAWLAGLIEGEGCIFVPVLPTAHTKYPMIRVAMTDEDIVRRCYEITNVGKFGPLSHSIDGRKPVWKWQVSKRKDVARILCAVAPLMGERRREKIAVAAERLALKPNGRWHPR